MALIKKHNTALGIFIVGVLVLLAVVMVRSGKFRFSEKESQTQIGNSIASENSANVILESETKLQDWQHRLMKALQEKSEHSDTEENQKTNFNIEFIEPNQKNAEAENEKEIQLAIQDLKLALSDLKDCFGDSVKSVTKEITWDPRNIQINDLLSYLKMAIGEPEYYVDKKVSWIVRKNNGSSEKIEMEVFQQGDNSFKTEVKKYLQDQRLGWIEISFSENDKREILGSGINHWLREGELISKNRAGMYFFKNKVTFDFSEIDGGLAAVEFTQGERYFKCQNIKHRETCICR